MEWILIIITMTQHILYKKGKKRIYNELMYCMLLHVMSNFLAISRQWNKKKSKHQLYMTVHIHVPTSIQRNRNLKQKEVI
jgi:hypothetical protein